MNEEDKIIIDLDNTITIDDDKEYHNKTPNQDIIKAIESAKQSNKVVIFTARNMRSFNKDLKKIHEITKPIAVNWLKKNSVEYDEIIFGKPWAGKNGWYIDDRNLSLEEFIFKFNGPYSKNTFDIVIPCLNEAKNIEKVYLEISKLERLFNLKSIIFVDNGSSDDTFNEISKLKKYDEKVKSVKVLNNIGYGNGIKKGLMASNSDYVILNHADGQFNAYNFIYSNINKILKSDAIIPIRHNRSSFESFLSMMLRAILSIISLKKVKDFNGQPKIFNLSKIRDINDIPDDFCFDYFIYKYFERTSIYLPVMQMDREEGLSSWNGSLYKTIKIFIRYIYFSIIFKR